MTRYELLKRYLKSQHLYANAEVEINPDSREWRAVQITMEAIIDYVNFLEEVPNLK